MFRSAILLRWVRKQDLRLSGSGYLNEISVARTYLARDRAPLTALRRDVGPHRVRSMLFGVSRGIQMISAGRTRLAQPVEVSIMNHCSLPQSASVRRTEA